MSRSCYHPEWIEEPRKTSWNTHVVSRDPRVCARSLAVCAARTDKMRERWETK
jgi:hypothetical protein